jgi:hypothetical protein
VIRTGRLAAALILIRRAEFPAAAEILPEPGADADGDLMNYLRFYLAWKRRDLMACRHSLAAELVENPFVKRPDQALVSVRAWALWQALRDEQTDAAWMLLQELCGPGRAALALPQTLVCLVSRLIAQGMPQPARMLLQWVRRESPNTAEADSQHLPVDWTCQVLECLVAANLGQYTVCVDRASPLLAGPLPAASGFGGADVNRRMAAWCGLLRVVAEVAQAVHAAGLPTVGWHAVRRTLDTLEAVWKDEPDVRAYGHLIHGVVQCLDPDQPIGPETIEHLHQARQVLSLTAHTDFVEHVIGELRWRQQVLEAFWMYLGQSDYRSAHRVFHEEVLPKLGARVPPAIRLGMVLVDRGLEAASTHELCQRLEQVHRENPELDTSLIDKVRRYLLEGDHQLELARALNARRPCSAARPVASRSLEALERLVETVLAAVTAVSSQRDAQPPDRVADRILETLPPLENLPPEARSGHLRLFVWANLTKRRFEPVCRQHELIRALAPDLADRLLLAARGWGQETLLRNDLEQALMALQVAAAVAEPDVRRAFVLQWGVRPLTQRCGEASVRWFLAQAEQRLPGDPPEWHAAVVTAAGVALLQIGRYAEGRDTQPYLAQFSAAIDQVESPIARTRLKEIEANLVTRVQATDQALEFIERGDTVRLRELKASVLDPLADAIPPLLRASVYLMLGTSEPTYDPLPDLRRIPLQPAYAMLVQRCINQAQATRTLRQLAAELVHPDGAAAVLPALQPLTGSDPAVVRAGLLAAALILIRRGEFAAAGRILPEPREDTDRDEASFLQLYLAWERRDLVACRHELATGLAQNRFLKQPDRVDVAVRAWNLWQALEDEQVDSAWDLLRELSGSNPNSPALPQMLVSLVARLLARGRPQPARMLLECVRRDYPANAAGAAPPGPAVSWTCQVLECLVAARLVQYAVCIDRAVPLVSGPFPAASGFGGADVNRRMAAWCGLLRLVAEIAVVGDQPAVGWRLVQRTLQMPRPPWEDEPGVREYMHLIRGIMQCLDTDQPVAAETIDHLHRARQVLHLVEHSAFVERAISELRGRKQVLDGYWNHLAQSDYRSAHRVFHEELLPLLGERIPPAISLGMVLADRGLGTVPSEELVRRLDLLRCEHPELDSVPIEKVRHFLFEGDRQVKLARALNARQPCPACQPGAGRSIEALQRLVEMVLLALTANPSHRDAQPPEVVAEHVLQGLPAREYLPPEAHPAYLRMFVWASLTLRRFEPVCQQHELICELAPDLAGRLLVAARGWGQAALLGNDFEQARTALHVAAAVAGPQVRRALALEWGLLALSHGNGATLGNWFLTLADQPLPDDPPEWTTEAAHTAAATFPGLPRTGPLAARPFHRQEPMPLATPEIPPTDSDLGRAVLSQACFLTALSLLAGTRDWAATPSRDEALTPERRRELLVQHRTLWRTLCEQLLPWVHRLGEFDSPWAWRGHLLDGLLASLDSQAFLDLPRLERFSAAIDRVESGSARTRLRNLEAVLAAKDKATDEAIALIHRRDAEALAQLKETLLDPLGNSIPPFVRAAVEMTLWHANPAYDPVPGLQRIPIQPGNEVRLQQCFQHVQADHTARQLARDLQRPEQREERLPSVEPLAVFGPAAVRQGREAVALVLLHRREFSATREALPEIGDGEDRELLRFLHFYLAWHQGDLATARRLLAAGMEQNRFLAQSGEVAVGARMRALLRSLDENQAEAAWEVLLELGGGRADASRLPRLLVCLVARFLERGQGAYARILLSGVRGVAPARTPVGNRREDASLSALLTRAGARFLALLGAPPDAEPSEIAHKEQEYRTGLEQKFGQLHQTLRAQRGAKRITKNQYKTQEEELKAQQAKATSELTELRRQFELLQAQRQTSAAACRQVQEASSGETSADSLDLQPLLWTGQVLECLVAAQLTQYTVCSDLAAQLLTAPAPRRSGFGDADANQRMLGWCGVLKLEAELALAAHTADTVSIGWRAVRRALEVLGPRLGSQPDMLPYLHLISGLMVFLGTDTWVDEEAVAQLQHVQQVLPFATRSAFVERVVGELHWRKQTLEAFWNYLGMGEFGQAYRVYRQELCPALGERLPPAIRLGAMLAEWGVGAVPAETLLGRLDVLQGETPELSAELIGQVRCHLQDGARQTRLAEALRGVGPRPPGPAADRPREALEQLAEAILTALTVNQLDAPPPATVAEQVLRELPPLQDLPPEVRPGCLHLSVWASLVLRRFDSICGEQRQIRELLPELADRVVLAAARAWGRTALLRGELGPTQAALDVAVAVAGRELRCELALAWGVAALETRVGDATVQWFQAQARAGLPADSPARLAALRFACGVALLQNGRYAEGREVLQQLHVLSSIGTAENAPSEAIPDETMLAQVVFLLALTVLAGTGDWATPDGARDPMEAGNDRAVLQSRALWKTLREQLTPLVRQLADFAPEVAWKGHLLAGLIASVDNETPFDMPRLVQFSAAIDRVDSRPARSHLKTIEAALVTRVKATDEALDLMATGDARRLRELKGSVLDPLGDIIPPLVRAAVYITLWNADPTYDPAFDLRRIPVDSSNEAQIRECSRHVQIAGTLRRLAMELVRPGTSAGVLPSLEPLAALDPSLARTGRVAVALILTRRGEFPAAVEVLPEIGEGDDRQLLGFLHFYLAWSQGDLAASRRLLGSELAQNPFVKRPDQLELAVRTRALCQALQDDQADVAWEQLCELGRHSGLSQLPRMLVCLVARLITGGQSQQARMLLNRARLGEHGLSRSGDATAPDRPPWAWTCQVLECLVAAQLAQYTVCSDLAVQLTGAPPPADSGFGGPQENKQMLGWCGLVRLESEIAQATHTADQLAVGWRAVRRALESQGSELEQQPHVQPYVYLISGLMTFLGTDTVASDETIDKLHAAQQVLPLAGRAAFIERVMAQLRWRRQVINDFWQHLGVGDFRAAREIFLQELWPALGNRTPHSIRLGMVLADWSDAAAPTLELLARLDDLQHEAADLNAELIAKVRDYLQNGERIRQVIRLTEAAEFEQVVELVDRTLWAGCGPGSMPVPIAVARLFALYKLLRTEEAQHFATQIAESRNLDTWVTDYGALLLGYIRFNNKQFGAAVEALARISTSTVLGHDTDQYWAAAQFNQGLQLLGAENKEQEAFEALARSLNRRGADADNSKLVPLFIHFGIKGLEDRQGTRSQHAFKLLLETLDKAPDSPLVVHHRIVAGLGERLCRSLMDEDVEELGGEQFLELLPQLQELSGAEEVPASFQHAGERALRVLAICQEIRRELRRDAKARRPGTKWYDYLVAQTTALDKLSSDPEHPDPMLLVLQGVTDLIWGGPGKFPAAMTKIEKAMRLGVQSPRLNELVMRTQKKLKEDQKKQAEVLDLFDVYLANGTVPPTLRNQLVRQDSLAELYRLNRNYQPSDIMLEDGEVGLSAFRQRLQHLLSHVSSEDLSGDPDLHRHRETLDKLLKSLKKLEDESHSAEQTILSLLAKRLRSQNLTSAKT